MNANVDLYFTEGCGRCPLGGTPQCKVNNWPKELSLLRSIVLECGLTEESKWGVPTYTFKKGHVVIVAAFKEYCALSFFKGALLEDADGILDKPGENTQSARLIKFTSLQDITSIEATLKAYVFEAIEVEKAGLQVDFKAKRELNYPEELQQKLDNDPMLKEAFEALTPGRQRGYVLHFSQPKQTTTRASRIEKCIPLILNGLGLNEHYGKKEQIK